MSMCVSTARTRTTWCPRSSPTDLARTPLWRSCTKTLHRDLLQSCQDVSYINLAKRACAEIGCRDLSKTSPIEILPGRSCQETSYNLEIEICTEILPRGLLQRSCQQSSYRDLVQRSCPETSCGDLAQRHCIEICCNLAKRPNEAP